MLPMFALKNVAFFGHMDGWEYQDRVMALCSFMCDALCSVFPKTSNQAWGWAVPFWRIFNWKVKISTRPRDKSCCHSSQPPPLPSALLCVSLSTYTYVGVLHPAHSSVISFLRLGAFECHSRSSQTEHNSVGWISLSWGWDEDDLWGGSSWPSPANGAAGFAPLLCTISCLASVCLN